MKSLLFFLLVSSVGCTSLNSHPSKINDLPDMKEAKSYINIFFDKYKNQGTKKAVDYIFSTNKSAVGLENLETKLDSTRLELGNFTGFEEITEKNAADGLILLSYLVKHENHPIRFTFIFYKPKDKWLLYKFNFDTELIDELEYSGKIYFIK